MRDGDRDVVRIRGDQLGGGGTVADEEIEETGRNDRALWDAGMDGLEVGGSGEVEASGFPTAEVGEKPACYVGWERSA